jgi:UDP-3-O-[3-hydroxymyristoyl] glucosamine N-acyltransferase
VHATTTVSETAIFHGTHPITIGSGTVIHPRARIYSFEGPVQIADGCVIGEKSTIGDNNNNGNASSAPGEPVTTRLSSSVIVGPHAVVRTGAYVRSAAVVDSLAIINREATVGSHSKVCSRCEVPEKAVVEDWTVIWAAGTGIGQRKRRRLVGPAATEVAGGLRPDAKRVEDARLIVLHKEREGLAKMIGLSASGQKRR